MPDVRHWRRYEAEAAIVKYYSDTLARRVSSNLIKPFLKDIHPASRGLQRRTNTLLPLVALCPFRRLKFAFRAGCLGKMPGKYCFQLR